MNIIEELFSLKGKNAVVTGASRGLGKRMGMTLAMAGARVVCVARNKEQLEATVKEIESAGGTADSVTMDMISSGSIKEGWSKCEGLLKDVDILVNCAGMVTADSVMGSTEEAWGETMRVNVEAVWEVIKLFTKNNVDRRIKGNIINISSVAGIKGSTKSPVYGASKAALINLAQGVMAELAQYGIRINTIAPGLFYTDMPRQWIDQYGRETVAKNIPIGHIAEPEALDGALLYLASNRASSYATGSTLVVDGGYLNKSSILPQKRD